MAAQKQFGSFRLALKELVAMTNDWNTFKKTLVKDVDELTESVHLRQFLKRNRRQIVAFLCGAERKFHSAADQRELLLKRLERRWREDSIKVVVEDEEDTDYDKNTCGYCALPDGLHSTVYDIKTFQWLDQFFDGMEQETFEVSYVHSAGWEGDHL